ncbi:MAG: phosphoribosylformylglycinamidine cyclo-ligase [Planctomycetes bacterium]|nr:phosphoribosylformylglycinamidine cyclo-ligase [Planctomycetota bacterium]
MARKAKQMTYAASGVDIDAGDLMVQMIRRHMQRTYGPRVIDQHGGFAGLFSLDYREKLLKRHYKDPVLVACTDGVGTKVKLAAQMGVYDTVGIDLVAMSVNDLIVGGAEPLLFLDYLAVNKLDPQQATDMVKGVADGCVQGGCALLGGETAEMPDVYAKGEFDMAGFAVGVIERRRVMDGKKQVRKGDIVLGLESSGIHSNGYSLVRAIVDKKKLKLDKVYPELETDKTLGQVLLTPTRIYAKAIMSVLHYYRVKRVISGMAHITGGGLVGNVNRVLPKNMDAKLERKSWTVPPIFRFLQKHGNVAQDEMDRVFNQGIGYCVIVRPPFAKSVKKQLEAAHQKVHVLGKIVAGSGEVKIV